MPEASPEGRLYQLLSHWGFWTLAQAIRSSPNEFPPPEKLLVLWQRASAAMPVEHLHNLPHAAKEPTHVEGQSRTA